MGGKATRPVCFHKTESRSRIELASVEFPAALQARDRAFEPAHSRKFLAATRTPIEEPPRALLHRKGQGMTTRFILDAEIAAGATPFCAMRWNAPATRAELREQMGQLVAERAIDFRCLVFAQARV